MVRPRSTARAVVVALAEPPKLVGHAEGEERYQRSGHERYPRSAFPQEVMNRDEIDEAYRQDAGE